MAALDAKFVSRNDALEFAAHTRKNLEYIESAYSAGEDVHVVTQVINSLLGLVVFLHERELLHKAAEVRLSDLEGAGWPHVEITKGENECSTLEQLFYHLRNSVAHSRIKFSSDSRDSHEVMIEFEDWKNKAKESYVCFEIDARALRDFCLKLMRMVEQEIG